MCACNVGGGASRGWILNTYAGGRCKKRNAEYAYLCLGAEEGKASRNDREVFNEGIIVSYAYE